MNKKMITLKKKTEEFKAGMTKRVKTFCSLKTLPASVRNAYQACYSVHIY